MGKKNKGKKPNASANKEEANKIKELFQKMPKRVEIGSEWFVVSMKWITAWQDYIGFDDEEGDDGKEREFGDHPGKIDNSDIFEDKGKLVEQSKKFEYQNI